MNPLGLELRGCSTGKPRASATSTRSKVRYLLEIFNFLEILNFYWGCDWEANESQRHICKIQGALLTRNLY